MNKQYFLSLSLISGFFLSINSPFYVSEEQQAYEEYKQEQVEERQKCNKPLWQREMDIIATSYFAGYIPEALNARYESDTSIDPVFWYTKNIPIVLPGRPYKVFVFAGKTNDVTNPDVENDISRGKFVTCKDLLELKKNGSHYRKSNVVIAGTCDEEQCNALKEACQRDLIWQAADGRLDKKHPYSVTPVFEIKDGSFNPKGELIDINNDQRFAMNLVLRNYVICQFYTLQKTRLSQGSYDEIGAIVATGDERYDEQSVCQALHFGNLRKLIDERKLAKNQDT